MKVRQDFVTNSSSSSFVIGKKDDEEVTIESVFQKIKGFYKEFISKRDAVIQYITDNPKLGMEYKVEHKCNPDRYYCHFFFSKDRRWKDYDEIQRMIERTFGISLWDNFEKEYDWLNCETYQDYEKYWLSKMNNENAEKNYVHAPFTIADFFEEKEVNMLHLKEKEVHLVNSKSDTLDWYYDNIREAFGGGNVCNSEQLVPYHEGDEYKKNEPILIPENKACLYLLGRVCVCSESGYIPEYVVERLGRISEYFCNHMG